jgi:hypothetical protein
MIKRIIKKLERLFFNLLKFDTLGYDFVTPKSQNVDQVRAELLNGYFQSQPGFLRIIIIKVYLFLKKSALFVIRRCIKRGR